MSPIPPYTPGGGGSSGASGGQIVMRNQVWTPSSQPAIETSIEGGLADLVNVVDDFTHGVAGVSAYVGVRVFAPFVSGSLLAPLELDSGTAAQRNFLIEMETEAGGGQYVQTVPTTPGVWAPPDGSGLSSVFLFGSIESTVWLPDPISTDDVVDLTLRDIVTTQTETDAVIDDQFGPYVLEVFALSIPPS